MTVPARLRPGRRRRAHRYGRLTAAGVVGGGGFLLGRTIALIAGGSLTTMVGWAAGLLLVELSIDAAAAAAGVRWLLSGKAEHGATASRVVGVMIAVHAVRVAVYVLGRTGPWVDFDVRPEHRTDPAETRSPAGVWVAGTGAAVSVIALLVVWRCRTRRRNSCPRACCFSRRR